MKRLPLHEREDGGALVRLYALLPPQPRPVALHYRTRTGALLLVDGRTAGAYDREHRTLTLDACERPRELVLEVERHALPTNALPSGPGVRWRLLALLARPAPQRFLQIGPPEDPLPAPRSGTLAVIGHSHLDVAWLWTYGETHRKARRTFANAVTLLDRDPLFVFAQSQPQLYAFVERDDPALFERVRELAAARRWDVQIAAMWVEPDCNLPSGESLLRQLLFARAYCERHFGVAPSIAWLPDTFGFANTLPTLLAHAGVRRFATTKLAWNDTTHFAHPRFVWRGPDGSEVTAASLASYDGGPSSKRACIARERGEPVIAGFGDGGGGVTAQMLAQVRCEGRWIRPAEYFEQIEAERAALPVHDGELYLEYHRGTYTTHHDVKAHNALLERALGEAEELLAWCAAVRAPRELRERLAQRLQAAWEIVLRNQFHDVLPGTSTGAVYADALREYAQAEELVASVLESAEQALPRAPRHRAGARCVEPVLDEGAYRFHNGLLHARVLPNGTLVELAAAGAPNRCAQANLLAAYTDRPARWEAWNLDAGYERTMRHAVPGAARLEEGGLVVPFAVGRSRAVMHLRLFAGEPFLRVDLRVRWRSRRTLLRVENWLNVRAQNVRYGTPHGSVVRSARRDTPERRARFEVPGQRFAMAVQEDGTGLALLALDTYGWSAQALGGGGLRLGHSLLRGTTWPDPQADEGEHDLSYAFAPLGRASVGALERTWQRFARDSRVRLFTCEDDAVLVAACKPAQDGDGVIVRVRECDGAARAVALRCGGRICEAVPVDALERPAGGTVRLEEETLHFSLGAHALRSFRVRFSGTCAR